MNNKVYFASPFFNEEQVEREERLKAKLRELGFDVWSPKENSVCSPNADADFRKKTFRGNVDAIMECDIIFGVTNGKDMGTIWECGYACAIRDISTDARKVVYYCENLPEGAQFNLMLAESGDVIITKFEDLDNLRTYLEEGKSYEGLIE